jgi:hypothetical protein
VKFPSVTVIGLITAPCEALFEIVSDPTRHPQIAGSGEVMEVEWITPPPVRVGSGFRSRQCIGWYQYPTRSYVQVYDPPYRFIWLSGPGFKKPPFGQLWGFDLQPLDARATLVSHLMRWPLMPVPEIPPFSWLMERGLKHELNNMKPTLYKLAKLANAEVIGDLQVEFDWCERTSPCGQRRGALIQA